MGLGTWKGMVHAVALLATGVTGCTGASRLSRPPPPAECPKDAVDTMVRQLGIPLQQQAAGVIAGLEDTPDFRLPVQEGQVAVVTLREAMGQLPPGTQLKGQVLLGTNPAIDPALARRSFLRFDEALTPDRKTYPVCMVSHLSGDGVPLLDNTTFEHAQIHASMNVRPVVRFAEGSAPP